MSINKIAWHYTTGENFMKIAESGLLLPATAEIEENEKPILWFSTAEHWEQTACKCIIVSGQIVRLSMNETRKKGGGLVRFGVPANTLIKWRDLPKAANMRKKIARLLELEGKRQGSNPKQWHGLVNALPITECICVQTINESMQ